MCQRRRFIVTSDPFRIKLPIVRYRVPLVVDRPSLQPSLASFDDGDDTLIIVDVQHQVGEIDNVIDGEDVSGGGSFFGRYHVGSTCVVVESGFVYSNTLGDGVCRGVKRRELGKDVQIVG
jgi:hypothetical protein